MNIASLTTIPKAGPMVYGPQFINGVPIAPATTIGPVDFRFPRAIFVTAILIVPGSGAPVDAAHLELRIQDETQRDIFNDGQGGGFFTPALAMHGFSWKPWDLQRPVVDGDHWFISVRNTYPAGEHPTITPTLWIYFDEPFLKRGAYR